MTRILIVAEHLDGQIRDVTLEMVTAASQLGNPAFGHKGDEANLAHITLAVIGADPGALLAGFDAAEVDEIVSVRVEKAEHDNEVCQSVLESLIGTHKPDLILMAFTANSIGYAAAVAVELDLGFASDVVAINRQDGLFTAVRPFYGGKVHGEVGFAQARPVLLMVRSAVWPKAQSQEGGMRAALSTEVNHPGTVSRVRHRQYVQAPAGTVDITKSTFLLAIGRGVGDDIARFEALAQKMGATLCASRPLIDAGLIATDRQVGQSGKVVSPLVYLAFGISGSAQHVAGINAAETIIAVNRDAEAPMFNVAQFGAVADLFEVAKWLEELY